MRPLLYAFLALSILAPFGGIATTVVNNGDGTWTLTENFEASPANVAPDTPEYNPITSGTVTTFDVQIDSSMQGTKNLRAVIPAVEGMAGIEFTDNTGVDLCAGTPQNLDFDVRVPLWTSNSAIHRTLISDTAGVVDAPFNTIYLDITRSGVGTYTLAATIQGETAPPVAFPMGVVAPPFQMDVHLSDVVCSPTEFTAQIQIDAFPSTQLVASDGILAGTELDTLTVGSASAVGIGATTRLDVIVFDDVEIPDDDGDGINNVEDNCPAVSNPGQEDADEDDTGDACELDTDGDGVIDDSDNCVTIDNEDQSDLDIDGIGDACDGDFFPDLVYSEDFESQAVGQFADGTFYDPSGSCAERLIISDNFAHGGTRSITTSAAGLEPATNAVGLAGDCQTDLLPDFVPCTVSEMRFWFLRDNSGGSGHDTSRVGFKTGASPTAQNGQISLHQQEIGVNQNGVRGYVIEDGSSEGGSSGVRSTADFSSSMVGDTWYEFIASEIDCSAASARIQVPAFGIDTVLDDDNSNIGLDRFSYWVTNTGSGNNARYYIDDLEFLIEGHPWADRYAQENIVGFDVDDLGKDAIILRTLPMVPVDPDLPTLLVTLNPGSSDEDGNVVAMTQRATDLDECEREDGVSIIAGGRDDSRDIVWDPAVTYVGCSPDGEINEIFIRNANFGPYDRCSFCQSDIEDNQNDVNVPDDALELGDVSAFPWTYTSRFDASLGVNQDHVVTAWGFSGEETGEVGLVAYAHNNNDQDATDTDRYSLLTEGNTANQICTWRDAHNQDTMVAAHTSIAPRVLVMHVDPPSGANEVEPTASISSLIVGPSATAGAWGASCAGAFVANVIPIQDKNDRFVIWCISALEGICETGQIAIDTTLFNGLTIRGITAVDRCIRPNGAECSQEGPDADAIAPLYGAFVTDSIAGIGGTIQYFRFLNGEIVFPCTAPMPDGEFFVGMEMDQGAQNLWVATDQAVYRYDAYFCTTGIKNDYNPPNAFGCQLCDYDGDGILNGFDPVPDDADCDDDGITDGEDPSVVCENPGTGEEYTCNNGVCTIDDPRDDGGLFGGGGGFGTIFGLDIPEPMCSILGIGLALLLGILVGWKTNNTLATGGAFIGGLILGALLFCVPFWVFVVVGAVGIAAGIHLLTARRGA